MGERRPHFNLQGFADSDIVKTSKNPLCPKRLCSSNNRNDLFSNTTTLGYVFQGYSEMMMENGRVTQPHTAYT